MAKDQTANPTTEATANPTVEDIGTATDVAAPAEFTGEIIISDALVPTEIINERAMTQEQFTANMLVAIKLTSYIGAASEDVSSRIGQPFEIIGAIQHPCTVRGDDGVEFPETRTVFKTKDGKNISFVSKAATSFFQNCLKPFFGMGDFAFPVKVLVSAQQASGTNRTYGFQVVA